MFNNLIESTSHAKEFKRRGSFLLFTTATYVVLIVITGVVSIYAYDAHLDTQTTELELLTFVPLPPAEVAPPRVEEVRPASNSDRPPTQSTRTDMVASTSDPTHVPPKVGTTATDVPPWHPGAVLGLTNVDPPTPAGSNNGVPRGTGTTPMVDIPDTPPPPAPPAPVIPKLIKVSQGVLTSKALFLATPNYPPLARPIKLQGIVTVQVLIDETGKVISAKAISGHPILVPEAQKAAMQSRFSPTLLSNQPVKVSGVITYNFKLQ
jgi:TonB family protein